MISKTFCILPWIHLSTRTNGHMRLCCNSNAASSLKTNYSGQIGILKEDGDNGLPSNLGHHDLLESWNNKYMRTVRLEMIRGKIPYQCASCFREEAAGHNSKRIWETAYWSRYIDPNKLIAETKKDGTVPEKIYYLDLRFGTKCNLKCIMCSPHDSSMWIGDWAKVNRKLVSRNVKNLFQWNNKGRENGASYTWYKKNPKFFEQLKEQIPHMKQLYMAGGEALIIKKYDELLDSIINMGYAKDITLRYNSNGLKLTDSLVEKWNEFKNVRFHFSIDSFEHMNKYIRWPTDWNIILEQLNRLDKTSDNVEVTIACAVQILNIYYIPDFIKWKLKMNYKKINSWPLGGGLINFHFVYHPPFLNVKVLPQSFKEKVVEKYEEFYKWLILNYRNDDDFINSAWALGRLKGLVNFMLSEDWSNRISEFKEYISAVDSVRGTDFKKTFPEMSELL